jgi:nitroreductase
MGPVQDVGIEPDSESLGELTGMSSIMDVITRRYSARHYQDGRLSDCERSELGETLALLRTGPSGSNLRFILVAATRQDKTSLNGLGTYGFIHNPAGFIIGAVEDSPTAMEDYGYAMEKAILKATDLGVGTCWLGGSFTQSSFARKIQKKSNELIPAVTAVGHVTKERKLRDSIRHRMRADQRLDWSALFFDGDFATPLSRSSAAEFATALDMVRLAPSASNKQPWRIIKDRDDWHFYCQRTPGYGKGSVLFTLLKLADLQRLDVGIAMCHFGLTARQMGLEGRWTNVNPGLVVTDEKTFYVATWQSRRQG